MEDEQMTVTVDQAARILGVSRSMAYLLVHRGELPARRIGRRWVVLRAGLTEFLAAR